MPATNHTFLRGLCGVIAVALTWLALAGVGFGQASTTTTVVGTQGVVGGVSIDTDGLLSNAKRDELGTLAKLRAQSLEKIPGDLNPAVETRKVSLRQLETALADCAKNNKPIPDTLKYLAGLQHINYIFVYPEQKDIVLVGPGEGWRVDARGNLVGVATGRPVMLLDDLLVALRTAQAAANGGITCSIDPTSEGLTRLKSHVSTLKTIGDPETTIASIENALGMQQISVHGVPATSHFARVLVAADYRMKRVAMNFEPSPVHGLPSFLQMVTASGRGMSNMLPRWWLEPRYEALLRAADGLAWEMRGSSVKAMTEEDFLTTSGDRQHTGKPNPVAQKWADLMTEKYPDLAVAEPIFGQLQNCMELAVVAAVIARERLPEKAGNSLSTLMEAPEVKPAVFSAPKQVESKASVLKKGRNWIISASGGVAINSWEIAAKVRPSEALGPARAKAAPAETTSWYWN